MPVTGSGASATGTSPATGAAAVKHRVRLELGAGVDDATVARLTKLGIIASVLKPAEPARALEPTAASADPSDAGARHGADALDDDAAGRTRAADEDAASRGAVTAHGPNATGSNEPASAATAPTETASAEPWPFENLLTSAAPFVFHSGWPATPIDPRVALSAVLLDGLLSLAADDDPAQDRQAAKDAAPRKAESKLSAAHRTTLSTRLARAIDAYTRFAAFASEDEDRHGAIAKEMLADLVIFSGDLFTLAPDKLLDAEVTTTIFDGKVVYTRQPDPASGAAAPDSE